MILFQRFNREFSIETKRAGLIALGYEDRSKLGSWGVIHFLVSKRHWHFGYTKSWYDGELHMFGLGPLFLMIWQKND